MTEKAIIRYLKVGKSTLANLIAYCGASSRAVSTALARLIESGYVRQTTINDGAIVVYEYTWKPHN